MLTILDFFFILLNKIFLSQIKQFKIFTKTSLKFIVLKLVSINSNFIDIIIAKLVSAHDLKSKAKSIKRIKISKVIEFCIHEIKLLEDWLYKNFVYRSMAGARMASAPLKNPKM